MNRDLLRVRVVDFEFNEKLGYFDALPREVHHRAIGHCAWGKFDFQDGLHYLVDWGETSVDDFDRFLLLDFVQQSSTTAHVVLRTFCCLFLEFLWALSAVGAVGLHSFRLQELWVDCVSRWFPLFIETDPEAADCVREFNYGLKRASWEPAVSICFLLLIFVLDFDVIFAEFITICWSFLLGSDAIYNKTCSQMLFGVAGNRSNEIYPDAEVC